MTYTMLLGLALLTFTFDEPKLEERVKSAKAFVAALAKEDYDGASKDFDETMKKVAPPEKLKTTWQQIIGQIGAIKKQLGTRTEKLKDYDIVFVTCEFDKTTLDIRVNYDKDGKLAGFSLVAPKKEYEFKPPTYVKSDSFLESQVTVGSGEWALPGTLTLPKGAGPFPAVVLLHGSGPNDRDETIGPNKPLRDLAWGLASRGVAVLRYEKRTREHGSKIAKIKDTFTIKEETVDDALSAVALLGKQKGIDPKKIFVVGHSLGAMMAPRIGELDPNLAGIVLMASPTRRLEDVIVEQFSYIYSLKGTLTDSDKEELEKVKKQAARLKDPKLSKDVPSEELPLGATAVYWMSIRDYDQVATARAYKKPILILQGERDYQVTMEDFAGWKKAMADHPNATLKSYPKLNHLFMDGNGKAKPAEYEQAGYVAEEVVGDLADWIKR